MCKVKFDWDNQKAWNNRQSHGISFEEAQTAFYDENARFSYDPNHSQDEDRYILLGLSSSFRLLVVCHVYRQSDELIRIVSARKATKREQKQYQDFFI